jgi:hypothetical protein
MRTIPPLNGNDATVHPDSTRRARWLEPPTLAGTVHAGVVVGLLLIVSVLGVIPAVFVVAPISPEADAVTLCLPGVGPVQRFTEDLGGEREELVYIHEGVHAKQCRSLGATAFAQRVTTPDGRLALEAGALCAEVAVLAMRGADRARMRNRTVELLASEYFGDGTVRLSEITAAVDDACGTGIGD